MRSGNISNELIEANSMAGKRRQIQQKQYKNEHSDEEEEYEIVFEEEIIGLTLCSDTTTHGANSKIVVRDVVGAAERRSIQAGDELTGVNGKSIHELEVSQIMQMLQRSPRPICLRFRPSTIRARLATDTVHNNTFENAVEPLSMIIQIRRQTEGYDDLESQQAVHSESFGEANSTRTTEDSSVLTDIPDLDDRKMRQASSRFSEFLRKPFSRGETPHSHRVESDTMLPTAPGPPSVEISLESPFKASLLVTWTQQPRASAYQLQYSRDRSVKVWKNWTGLITRSTSDEEEFVALISGLEIGKAYVIRMRYKLESTWGEWSSCSCSVLTQIARRI